MFQELSCANAEEHNVRFELYGNEISAGSHYYRILVCIQSELNQGAESSELVYLMDYSLSDLIYVPLIPLILVIVLLIVVAYFVYSKKRNTH